MSLQELTAALRQKEDDKGEVVKSLQTLQGLTKDGAEGRILLQVTEGLFEDASFDLAVLPTDCLLGVSDMNNKVSL
jgi:hypothetical protein